MSDDNTVNHETKQIDYRGGIVRFHILGSWVEEYEEEGGGIFYEDKPDSATLRLYDSNVAIERKEIYRRDLDHRKKSNCLANFRTR